MITDYFTLPFNIIGLILYQLVLEPIECLRINFSRSNPFSKIRWWNEFDSREKLLSFSRDRMVESFYWSMGIFCEAEFSLIRTTTAKLVALLTIIDDIYDSFGTLPELEIFTEAIERFELLFLYTFFCYRKFTYSTKTQNHYTTFQRFFGRKLLIFCK